MVRERMTRPIPLRGKLLVAFFVACALGSLGAWVALLTSICSGPRTPGADHSIAHGCHGMTVYMSDLQNTLLHWLLPVELVFILLSVVAGAIVFLAANAKVHIDIRIEPK